MTANGQSPFGRITVVVILLALLVIIVGAMFLLFGELDGSGTTQTETGAARRPANVQEIKRLSYTLAILLVSVLLILVFVIGTYVVIRVGRAVTQRPVGGEPTHYVDAWSSYRLSADEIDAATSESSPSDASDRLNADDEDNQNSDEDPDDSAFPT
ncbi:MAG: hypothetical protein KKB50_03825 [Planctomycetes bacterium]|nr:hypothetical protein [Planctomycetota bacterium]